MVDITICTTGGVRGGAVGRENIFFDGVTILFHQCNNTKITYQQFFTCLH